MKAIKKLILLAGVLGGMLVYPSVGTHCMVSAEETVAAQSAAPTQSEALDVLNSPYIGENGVYAEWTYDESTQCLTIRGNGETHSEESADPRNGDGGDMFDTQNIPRVRNNKIEKVKEIKILDGVTSIGSAAFARYHHLEKVTIPDSVRSIGNCVFYECDSLEEISIPDGVQSIGKECFFGCTALKKVFFGRNVSNFGEAVFGGCTSLSQVAVDEDNQYLITKNSCLYNKVEKILYVYYGNTSKNLAIVKGTKKIGAFAFAKNKKLKSVKIPASVSEIGGAAFYQCKNLQKVNFAKKSKCKIIKDYTWYDGDFWIYHGSFQGCKKLKQMIFPDSLQYIDDMCMKGCSNLQKVHYGKAFKGVKSAHDSEDIMPLYSLCVKEYSVSKGNKKFSSKNGVLYNKKKNRLLYYPSSKKQKKFKMPKSVTSIRTGAFSRCKYLKSVIIVRENVNIETNAFWKSGKVTIIWK